MVYKPRHGSTEQIFQNFTLTFINCFYITLKQDLVSTLLIYCSLVAVKFFGRIGTAELPNKQYVPQAVKRYIDLLAEHKHSILNNELGISQSVHELCLILRSSSNTMAPIAQMIVHCGDQIFIYSQHLIKRRASFYDRRTTILSKKKRLTSVLHLHWTTS